MSFLQAVRRSVCASFLAGAFACAPANLSATNAPDGGCERVLVEAQGNPSDAVELWVPERAVDVWFNDDRRSGAPLSTPTFRMLLTTDGEVVGLPDQAGLRPHDVEVWATVRRATPGLIERFFESMREGCCWEGNLLNRPMRAGLHEIEGLPSRTRIFTNVGFEHVDPNAMISCINESLAPQTYCEFWIEAPQWELEYTAHPDRIEAWRDLTNSIVGTLDLMRSQEACETLARGG